MFKTVPYVGADTSEQVVNPIETKEPGAKKLRALSISLEDVGVLFLQTVGSVYKKLHRPRNRLLTTKDNLPRLPLLGISKGVCRWRGQIEKKICDCVGWGRRREAGHK